MICKSLNRHSLSLSCLLGVAVLISACGDAGKPAAEPKAAALAQQPAVIFSVVANNAPHFESATGWGSGYAEAKALGKGKGVVVGPGPDNPNVFAQNIAAKGGEPVKIVAKASSVDKPQAQGRLQINWHGNNAKYISTSSQVITVSLEEKTFEYQTVAPPGASAGILYVVPQGPDDIVRYTEMSLLKAK